MCEFDGGTHAPEDPFDKDLKVGMQLTIIAHVQDGDYKMAVFSFNPNNPVRGNIAIDMGMHGCFRPIRTPEQIAAEERDKAIQQIIADFKYTVGSCTYMITNDQAARMYDAGYRKQVAP
ncbi:hypothetical protein D3C78_1684380 [compost metagenome]